MAQALHRLKEFGCPIVATPIMPDGLDTTQPFLAVMEASEAPTDAEVVIISKLILHLARTHGSRPGAAGDRDALTITLRKSTGRWSYAKANYSGTVQWSDLDTLEQLIQPFNAP